MTRVPIYSKGGCQLKFRTSLELTPLELHEMQTALSPPPLSMCVPVCLLCLCVAGHIICICTVNLCIACLCVYMRESPFPTKAFFHCND